MKDEILRGELLEFLDANPFQFNFSGEIREAKLQRIEASLLHARRLLVIVQSRTEARFLHFCNFVTMKGEKRGRERRIER